MKRKLIVAASCMGLLAVTFPLLAMARQTVVNGTIGVGFDYWDRTYENEDQLISEGLLADKDEGDKQEYGIWPEVTITSQGVRDSMSFRYAPVFKYDEVTSDNEVDHYLDLFGERSIKSNWSVSLDNRFQQTDDPSLRSERTTLDASAAGSTETAVSETGTATAATQGGEPRDELSRDEGRRRYWTNDLRARTDYSFGEESTIGGGYAFRVLRNDSDNGNVGYREYDRHNAFVDLAYRHSQSYRSSVILDFVKGLYDDTEDPETGENVSGDLQEYRARLQLDYLHSISDYFPFVYNFVGVEYDNEIQRDSYAHEFTLGWSHDFNPRTSLTIGGGPTYVNGEGVKGEWDYNAYLDFKHDFTHSSFTLFLEKKYDTRNFSGSSADAGFQDTVNARARYDHQITRDFSFDLFALYRWESNLDPQGDALDAAEGETSVTDGEASIGDVTYDKNIYELGAGLNYDFLRYYNASLRYRYYVSDGDLFQDQYKDHRVLFTLSASTDLWRW